MARSSSSAAALTIHMRAQLPLSADFGSAKVQATHAGQATTRGGGTEGWQSPEAMVNEGATQASDIFSLGLIFFFVLTGGGHPFGALGAKRTKAMMRLATTDLDEEEEVAEADAKVGRRVASALVAAAGFASREDADLIAKMLRLAPRLLNGHTCAPLKHRLRLFLIGKYA